MSAIAFRANRLPVTSLFTKAVVCAFALAAATAAAAVSWPDYSLSPVGPYYLAVLIAAIYGGSRFGVASIAASVLLVDAFFLGAPASPDDSSGTRLFNVMSPQATYACALFVVVSATIVWLLQLTRAREQEATSLKEQLVAVLDAAQLAYWSTDPRTGRLATSDRHSHMFGRGHHKLDWSHAEFLSHVHEDDRERVARHFDDALRKGVDYDPEFRVVWPDASVHWLQSLGRAAVEGGGVRAYGVLLNIDDRKRAEEELVEVGKRLADVFDSMTDAVFALDRDWRFTYLNKQSARVMRRNASELIGSHIWTEFPDAENSPFHKAYERAMALPGMVTQAEAYYAPLDSWFHVTAYPAAGGITIYMMDVTQRRRAEDALARHSFRQTLIADFGHRALVGGELDDLLDSAIAVVNDGLGTRMARVMSQGDGAGAFLLEASVGWEAGQPDRHTELLDEKQAALALSTRSADVVADVAADARFAPSAMLRAGGIVSAVEVPIIGLSGSWGVLGAYAGTADAFSIETVSYLESVANTLATVIDRKRAAQRVTWLSRFDQLTGLATRGLFVERVQQSIMHARRNDAMSAVLFIDLDRFKVVNDTLGHGAGDELLRHVAQRLSRCVRSSDSIGRLGGDEFALVIPHMAKSEDARIVGRKITEAMAEPFELFGHTLYATASVGIALFPEHGDNADTLLKNADTAMFRAKRLGNSSCRFYEPQMNERAFDRLQTETELRGALERKEFVLHYQPKVDLVTGEITGFEALLRWHHQTRGLVPPLEFIGILEDTGLIVQVGEWVLREACRQINEWAALGLPARNVAVNLSARQFRYGDLDVLVERVLAETGAPPGMLELEITESMLMEDPNEAVRLLKRIHASGVRLSVDDFGTGYSSLAYLKRFPLDALKIDRVFVRDVCTDENDATIALAIISLAHSLGLKVVAEGVESEDQIALLRAHGCDEIQGFHFARPSPPDACTRMLRQGKRLTFAEASPAVATLANEPSDSFVI